MTDAQIQFLREVLRCDSLALDLREDWSARAPDSRLAIRRELSSRFGEDLTDLSSPPHSEQAAISISHCRLLGGFACADRAWKIGFDVEELARVRENVLARVSTPEELREAPSLGALWAAKEAAFKALSPSVELVSEICVTGWSEVPVSSELNLRDVFKFKLSKPQTTPDCIQTIVFTRESLIFAIILKASAL